MTLHWRRLASRARGKMDPRNAAEGAVAGLGVALAIGAMEWLSLASHYPLAIIPFATSIALVVGSPDAEPAQPRALVGGHVVATLVGLAMVKLTGPGAWAAAAAVGLAILAMYLTGTFHPPAGIDPLLVVSNGLSLVISVGARAGGRSAADGVRLFLAPLAAPPAVAAALAVRPAPPFCSSMIFSENRHPLFRIMR